MLSPVIIYVSCFFIKVSSIYNNIDDFSSRATGCRLVVLVRPFFLFFCGRRGDRRGAGTTCQSTSTAVEASSVSGSSSRAAGAAFASGLRKMSESHATIPGQSFIFVERLYSHELSVIVNKAVTLRAIDVKKAI